MSSGLAKGGKMEDYLDIEDLLAELTACGDWLTD